MEMEMESKPKNDLSPEEIAFVEFAYELSKQAISEMQIKDISEYVPRHDTPFSSRVFKQDFPGQDMSLTAEVGTHFGDVRITFSLHFVACHFLRVIENLLDDETAQKVLRNSVNYELKKRNIKMSELFDLKPEEIDEAKRHHVVQALKMFIWNIPVFGEASIVDAIAHTKVGYFQNFVKPQLKDRWNNLGLPEDFDLIMDDELDPIRKDHVSRKRWFLGNKKQMLNMAKLPDLAKQLREQYRRAKARYKECKKSFFTLSPSSTEEQWQIQWANVCQTEFPSLHSKAINEIEHHPPFELVNIHLAEVYDYDEETMRKKITKARSMKATAG